MDMVIPYASAELVEVAYPRELPSYRTIQFDVSSVICFIRANYNIAVHVWRYYSPTSYAPHGYTSVMMRIVEEGEYAYTLFSADLLPLHMDWSSMTSVLNATNELAEQNNAFNPINSDDLKVVSPILIYVDELYGIIRELAIGENLYFIPIMH